MSSSIPRLATACLRSRVPSAFCWLARWLAAQSSTAPADLVIKNATVMTASHGTIQHGSVWLHNGKIAGRWRDCECSGAARLWLMRRASM